MNSIPFTCPHCDHFKIVEGRFAGQTGSCANCGQETTIPHRATEEDLQKAEASRERTTKDFMPVMISSIAAVVIVALLVLIGAKGVMEPLLAKRSSNKKVRACSSNLARIGIALNRYHQRYGCYPPPAVRGSDGKRLLSWRVLILPFMGDTEARIYDQIDLTKAWDDPVNARVTAQAVGIFRCPASGGGGQYANYIAITGKGTAFDSSRQTSKVDVKDGLARTICIVEVRDAKVNWAEPIDLDINRISFKVNATSGNGNEISSGHRSGICHAVCCDGTVRTIHPSIRPVELRAMATINGGEPAPK